MENYKTIIDPVEEALRLTYLNANLSDSSVELNRIIESNYSSKISPEKAKEIVNSLYQKLACDSLGILISKTIEAKQISVSEIAVESNLPISTIQQLMSDSILANSIPVVSFKNLLKKLQIPFQKVQESVFKTFHILKNDLTFSPTDLSMMRLAYKGRTTNPSMTFESKTNKGENQYLFQNEEMLNKYLNRLNELYNNE